MSSPHSFSVVGETKILEILYPVSLVKVKSRLWQIVVVFPFLMGFSIVVNAVDPKDTAITAKRINYLISNKFNNIKNMMSNTNYGFLYRKTIYKVKRGDDI